jgi:P27 family predicted phage terminase small subunit
MKNPDPPKTYTAEARTLWRDVVDGWTLDPVALKTVAVLCESLQLYRKANALVEREGLTVQDRFTQVKPHPAIQIARDAAATYLSALRALNLDLEPLQHSVGRPPKLGLVS